MADIPAVAQKLSNWLLEASRFSHGDDVAVPQCTVDIEGDLLRCGGCVEVRSRDL